MDDALVFFLGAAAGGIAAGLIARWTIRRIIRRVRAAERRARDAERLADLGAMTSGLAHEIKNPLSTISLNAQLLAEGVEESGLEDEPRGRLTRRISSLRREVERLKGILTDFLQYAGELRLQPAPADLNVMVDELVDFYLPQAEHHGVRLRTDPFPGPLLAEVDVPLVKQAVLNLLLNAVQAMCPGGSPAPGGPEAPASGAAPRELILRTHPGKDQDGRPTVNVHVIDTGPGIPAEALARIFQPYFTTKSGGTGLGLPTTRRLIEAHGGRIEVFTEVGKGTDFMIVLPAGTTGTTGTAGRTAQTPAPAGTDQPRAESSAAPDNRPPVSTVAR